MAPFTSRPWTRWLVPATSVVVLVGAGSVVAAVSSAADGPLPARTASQLLVDVAQAKLAGLSGDVTATSDLGLPALPGAGKSSEFSSLLSGTHTLKVWAAGPEQARVALLGDFGESDVVRDGSDLWTWSSTSSTAHHVDLPTYDGAEKSDAAKPGGLPSDAQDLTPQALAERALASITPTTSVSTDPGVVVAGRPAYELVLEPDTAQTLVGRITIAIDGETHVPTQVQVFPRGSATPALSVGFSSFDPTTPDSSVFAFTPPPGATVTEGLGLADAAGLGDGSSEPAAPAAPRGPNAAPPKVSGSGWARVVVADLPSSPTPTESPSDSAGTQLQDIVDTLPTVSGDWGSGHLLAGRLFSAVLTDEGRVAVGAVPPERLYAALSTR